MFESAEVGHTISEEEYARREPALRAALDAAIEQAEKSWREGGIPIGSALVNERGTIVSVGHNRRVQRGSVVLHAEMDCMENAGRRRDWSSITDRRVGACALVTAACVGETLATKRRLVDELDRYGRIVDPFGHEWSFSHRLANSQAA